MSAPPYEEAPYYKDLVHNLGYKPLVDAKVYMNAYSVNGWRQVPIFYYEREWIEEVGWIIISKSITYEHLDNNTIRFYGQQNSKISVKLFLEPRKDAWYS